MAFVDYNKLYKNYNKILLEDHKANVKAFDNCLTYFIDYLKFLRDHLVIESDPIPSEPVDIRILSITAAIDEYDEYLNCAAKYFTVKGGQIKKLIDGTDEEVSEKFMTEKLFHWNNFWDLVKLNIESWGNLDASN